MIRLVGLFPNGAVFEANNCLVMVSRDPMDLLVDPAVNAISADPAFIEVFLRLGFAFSPSCRACSRVCSVAVAARPFVQRRRGIPSAIRLKF